MDLLAAWCQAGFQPDSFWLQTPATFQACMAGAQARMKSVIEGDLSSAWHGAAFTGAAQAGKLKPLNHYLKAPPRTMSHKEMLANMQMLAANVNRKFGS